MNDTKPRTLNQLTFADDRTSGDYHATMVYQIIGQTWYQWLHYGWQRLAAESDNLCNGYGGETNEPGVEAWVKNNYKLLAKFKAHIFATAPEYPDLTLLEQLQYPCDTCGDEVAVRDAYLISEDEYGELDNTCFPGYFCAACGEEKAAD